LLPSSSVIGSFYQICWFECYFLWALWVWNTLFLENTYCQNLRTNTLPTPSLLEQCLPRGAADQLHTLTHQCFPKWIGWIGQWAMYVRHTNSSSNASDCGTQKLRPRSSSKQKWCK
jgi:hypothetical protein